MLFITSRPIGALLNHIPFFSLNICHVVNTTCDSQERILIPLRRPGPGSRSADTRGRGTWRGRRCSPRSWRQSLPHLEHELDLYLDPGPPMLEPHYLRWDKLISEFQQVPTASFSPLSDPMIIEMFFSWRKDKMQIRGFHLKLIAWVWAPPRAI